MWTMDENVIRIEVPGKTYTHKLEYHLDTGEIWIRASNEFMDIRELVADGLALEKHDDDTLPKLRTLNQALRSGLLQFLDDLRIAMQPILSRDK